MGIASGPAVIAALNGAGIRVVGRRWRWRPGLKGQTYEPHYRRDGVAVFNPNGFVGEPQYGALPGDGLSPNDRYCMCTTRLILRGARGKFLPEREG